MKKSSSSKLNSKASNIISTTLFGSRLNRPKVVEGNQILLPLLRRVHLCDYTTHFSKLCSYKICLMHLEVPVGLRQSIKGLCSKCQIFLFLVLGTFDCTS